MAVLDSIVNSYATLVNLYPQARQKIWAKIALLSSERKNIFSKLEGPDGSMKPIWRKDDFRKSKGDVITFTTLDPLGAQPRTGSALLTGFEEDMNMGTFSLQIDFKRHATGQTLKHKMLTAIELEASYAKALGQHCGWAQETDAMMSFRKMAGTWNTSWAGNRGSINKLQSADTLTTSLIETAGTYGRTVGALPVKMSDGESGLWSIPHYLVVAPHISLQDLRQTTQWQQSANYAAERGKGNPLFSGDFYDWDGHAILPHETQDVSGFSPIGSSWVGKAYLGVPIAAGTAAVTIQGGFNAQGASMANPGGNGSGPAYFQFFENYDWQWVEGQTANPDATDRYCLIYNTSEFTVGDGSIGKFGFYRYEVNNGYVLTTAAYSGVAGIGGGRLSVTANTGGADTRHTSVGNVTFTAGVHTENHPAGSYVIQTNSYGVPYCYSMLLGQGSMLRGYGEVEGEAGMKMIHQEQDYGMKKTIGYMIVYGQTPYYDSFNIPRRFVRMLTSCQHPGITLPVVSY
jgi:N4-gp56 family major capsid protein